MFADAAHVLAMSAWMGGLVLLVVLATSGKTEEALESMPIWSRVATLSVLVISLTGVALGYRELGGVSDILGSTYGRLLSLKVGLVLVALLIATLARDAVQRRWGLDSEELAAADEEREALISSGEKPAKRRGHSLVPNEAGVSTLSYVLPEATARRRLLRSVFAEISVLVFVIGVTAVLVNTAPAKSLKSGPWSATLEVGELLADIGVSPARTGANEVHLTLNAAGGGPAQVLDVAVEFSLPSSGIAPIDVEMRSAGIAHYISVGFTPPVAGDWSMTLKVLVDPITEESANATVPIR
jgi:copper transport protein